MAGSGSNQSPDKDRTSSSPYPSETAAAGGLPRILIVEDNRSDVFLIREAMKAAKLDADLSVLQDGEAALLYFDNADRNGSVQCPDLVILDINLPKRQGNEVLEHIRNSRRCTSVPVLVVTSSDSARDRETMGRLGISGYFRKPSEYDDFMKLGEVVRALLGSAPPSLPTAES